MQKESINITNYPMLLAAQQQLYDYAIRLRFGGTLSINPYTFYQRYNSRYHEEPKPSYSYIGLISMAILSSPERQLVLSDIYRWILEHYPYFRTRGSGWRNSIRHNLSLNDCFVKADRSTNGKGHYWSIHPANLADFISGDFRRRRAQRRVRKSMGLSVSEDENEDDDEDLSIINRTEHHFEHSLSKFPIEEIHSNITDLSHSSSTNSTHHLLQHLSSSKNLKPMKQKRCFNVDSLLAPEQPCLIKRQKIHLDTNEDIYSPYSKSDVYIDTDTST